jgi:integrase
MNAKIATTPIAAQEYVVAPQPQTNRERLDLFLASRKETCQENAIATYRATLSTFIDWLGEHPMNSENIQVFLTYQRERGLAEESQRNFYRQIKTLCRWLYDWEYLDRDPFTGKRKVTPPKRTRSYRVIYSRDDVVKLLNATGPVTWKKERETKTRWSMRRQWKPDGPLERDDLQARAMVLLMVDSALRNVEVCRLTCGHLRAKELIIVGKDDDTLPFFIGPETRKLLLELAGDRPDDAPLFRNWSGNACQPRDLLTLLHRLARRAEVTLPPRPAHAFRHYAARQWKAAGLSDLVIMDLMRHASVQTTQLYTNVPDLASLKRLHAGASSIAQLLIDAGLP